MKTNNVGESETTQKVHYKIIGKNIKKVLSKLEQNMHYYRFIKDKKFVGQEIVYDVPNNLLSNAGLILSKQYDDEGPCFKMRKISKFVDGYKHPSQKFSLGECEEGEQPKDFPMQISTAINNFYNNVFTIDLVSVVRQTEPKINITVKGQKYKIKSGTGYEATFMFETAIYHDIKTNKKVKQDGVTVKLPGGSEFEKDNAEVLESIDHYAKELVPYNLSRFEIAQRLLYPKAVVMEEETSDGEEEEAPQENKKKKKR